MAASSLMWSPWRCRTNTRSEMWRRTMSQLRLSRWPGRRRMVLRTARLSLSFLACSRGGFIRFLNLLSWPFYLLPPSLEFLRSPPPEAMLVCLPSNTNSVTTSALTMTTRAGEGVSRYMIIFTGGGERGGDRSALWYVSCEVWKYKASNTVKLFSFYPYSTNTTPLLFTMYQTFTL